ncbi:hypothetical protein [Bacillus sp. FDAARGOS_1420]|uniref:hypothetical protein n=1 Tax=Bacillus sp. FDAARGOS_1420 TaxID=2856338 RepID=UPI001C5B7D6C|nr:hypothetical protein [Bacillus sp. FDAARGOS_1420]MBW3496891.1 hypothetical protein [Bacillus sp. FDAARGOS_1420]MBW3496904.1 hypothetical protein [Bacillus sp. FDAARGOS_1420]
MIESVELNIYLDDDDSNSISLSLSPVQTEVIFKALGLKFHQDNTCSHFSDQTLKKHILPKINFKKKTSN